jgi:ABC-type antimicrobial peptide transport system permease subunit
MLVLRDHVLRSVIEQLERNIAMISVLYPIMVALAAFVSVGLTMLLLMTVTRQATIMRVLGMTKQRVVKGWMFEQVFLCLTGVVLGSLVSILVFGNVNMLGVIIYLFSNVITGLVFMMVLVRRKLLGLLQTRE